MQASETKLQKIIEGTQQYVIPLFQRTYSWQKLEWQALWEDLTALCDEENPRPHFMGSMVTMPTTSVPQGVSKFLLIDGQQRLTTVFLLLAALRDIARTAEVRLAEEIQDRFLMNRYEDGDNRYKLQPTQVDRLAFHRILDEQPQIDGSSITECYRFFQKKFRSKKPSDLRKIKDILCSNLSLVSVVLGESDDPYLVFESLNAKGRPLTQADLIRNYFFMRIHSNSHETVDAKYWQPMQNLLGEHLTEFIRAYLTRTGVEVKQSEVYFVLKERLCSGEPLTYLQDLARFAEHYARLLQPERESQAVVRKYLTRLNRLEVTVVYPFLLNCYDDWRQNRLTTEEFKDVLKVLENFILRRFVCNIQTQGLNKVFAALYAQVSQRTDLTTDRFVSRLQQVLQNINYPKDTEFRQSLLTVKLYGGNRSEKGKLILESLEECHRHKEVVDFENLTIEHVMPQTLSAAWQQELGDDGAETHELWLHTLGNLTLTAYNSELTNSSFAQKKERLSQSHLELNRYFQSQATWTRTDIEQRAEKLANLALTIWPYFGQTIPSTTETTASNVTARRPQNLWVLGAEHRVKTWRDVMECTLNAIAKWDEEAFQEIMRQFPRFVSSSDKDFRDPRNLRNGTFMEANLSAKAIMVFCQKVCETAGLSPEDWRVEYQ